MGNNLVLSVEKALNIMDILVFEDIEKNGLRLSELSKKTGIKANTLHNLLKTMIVKNYIQQYDNGNYAIGSKISKIGMLSQINQNQYQHGLQDILQSLRETIKENVIFSIVADGKWKLIKQLSYESAIQINVDKVEKTCIYEKATGRILTAFCSTKELEEIIKVQGMPNEKWGQLDTLVKLNEERSAIREKGYYDMYTQNNQLWAIGIAVVNKKGELLGSIGCAAPAFRCDQEKRENIKKEFIKISSDIEKLMI